MIARGVRDHERSAFRIELQQHIHGAAIFERPAGLQVFALEEHLGAHAGVERRRPHDRCAHHVRADTRGRGDHVGERRARRRLHDDW